MADRWDQEQLHKLAVRGLGWCLCLALWTVALLTIFASRVGHAVTPEAYHFPAAKFLHVWAYTFLTVYLKWLPLRRWRWLALALLSLHAFGTEFLQQFIPGRHPAFTDVLFDHCGLALGMVLTWKRWRPRRNRSLRSGKAPQGASEPTLTSLERFSIATTTAQRRQEKKGFSAR